MESDPNIFPKIELFKPLEVIKSVGRFVVDRIYPVDIPNTGAAPMLDRELYEQQEFDYGIYE